MLPHDKALALSAVDVEQLRDLRARLGRRAVSDKAAQTLGTVFFQLCDRVGVTAGSSAETQPAVDVARAATSADMAGLRRLRAGLEAERTRAPQGWAATVAAGAPQAILSRRLALAGREPPVDAQ